MSVGLLIVKLFDVESGRMFSDVKRCRRNCEVLLSNYGRARRNIGTSTVKLVKCALVYFFTLHSHFPPIPQTMDNPYQGSIVNQSYFVLAFHTVMIDNPCWLEQTNFGIYGLR